MKNAVKQYIADHWDMTVRSVDPNNHDDNIIVLPRPYTVPCMSDSFQELYYWDTYFTNRGLLVSGREDLARDNLIDFMYMINTYGLIPNGSRTYYLNRSQPAFFGMMVRDYYKSTGDKEFLADAYRALVKEYDFWMTGHGGMRCAPNGLNCYSAHPEDTPAGEGEFAGYVHMYQARTGRTLEGDVKINGRHVMAEAESGWDFNPRFHGRCHDHNPVDLNSLLWFDESFLAECERILGIGDGAAWDEKAASRKEKMVALMRDERGVFFDYDYANATRGDVVSCAAFYPAFVGMITDDRGMDQLLEKLELAYGLQSAEPSNEGNFQWGACNGWAALQLVAVEALEGCGRKDDANRIAEKYIGLVERTFADTHAIWEKYNIITGDHNAVGEYDTPEMMGWSAGVYLALAEK